MNRAAILRGLPPPRGATDGASSRRHWMKEKYLTEGNLGDKTRGWLDQIDRHERRRERFGFDISTAALLVLDMQNFFLSEDSHAHIPSADAILPRIRSLIDHFRDSGRPVIFTRHSVAPGEEPGIMARWWRDVVLEGTDASELTSGLAPGGSEVVLRKTRYSAFVGTGLESMLREDGVSSVVVTGVATHLCCESTARDAFMKDLVVYFVVDATATWNEELHVSSMRSLSDGFAILVSAEDILGTEEGG